MIAVAIAVRVVSNSNCFAKRKGKLAKGENEARDLGQHVARRATHNKSWVLEKTSDPKGYHVYIAELQRPDRLSDASV